jgi:hypothetical protein
VQELYIVNYCNPNCTPLQSITRLPEVEAFALAKKLSEQYKGEAFYRLVDFVNYYPRRIRTEKWLYDWFIKLGGVPETEHPLYFVLQRSDYLYEWFDRGEITRLPLNSIDAKHISFTFGDSNSKMDKPERRNLFLKNALFELISHYGNIDMFFGSIKDQYKYIEAQLWNDSYCR